MDSELGIRIGDWHSGLYPNKHFDKGNCIFNVTQRPINHCDVKDNQTDGKEIIMGNQIKRIYYIPYNDHYQSFEQSLECG